MIAKTQLRYFFMLVIFTSFYSSAQTKTETSPKKVTFYELGSVRCIPCIKMQPVFKSIEEKYNKDVQVVFYDVWTKEGKEAAKNFTFDSIPTQIFVDENGKEFFRHVGYFPESDIEVILAQKGITK